MTNRCDPLPVHRTAARRQHQPVPPACPPVQPCPRRFLSRDTWAYNFQNPVELNRYGYAAGNPVRWGDPSGNFAEWGKLNEKLSQIGHFFRRQFGDAVVDGFEDGIMGYIGGVIAYSLLRLGIEVLEDLFNRRVIDILDEGMAILSGTFDWGELVLNGIAGAFLGKLNEKAFKSEYWQRMQSETIRWAELHGFSPKQIVDQVLNSLRVVLAMVGHTAAVVQALANKIAFNLDTPGMVLMGTILLTGLANSFTAPQMYHLITRNYSLRGAIAFNTFGLAWVKHGLGTDDIDDKD